MFEMLPGFEERVITVVTPAEVARRAATILVDMPPVPRVEPALDTIILILAEAQAESEGKVNVPSAVKASMSSTTSMA